MKAYLVTEGNSDAAFLGALLNRLFPDLEIIPGGGTSAAVSFARTLAATRKEPCVLFLDADAVTAAGVRERKMELEEMLRSAGPRGPFYVAVAAPQIESLLFASPDILSGSLGITLSADQVQYGQVKPKEVLAALFGDDGGRVGDVLSRLDEKALSQIRESPPVRGVIQFLRHAESQMIAA